MLFNSLSFALFLPIVFLLYWGLARQNYRLQNIILLIASYLFYACWDYRFLLLLAFSTALDYFTGIMMHRTENSSSRKVWFWLSVCINLGFLAVFKYYNFFITSFAEGLSRVGISYHYNVLHLILPVGISFYTFHGLSYVIDIYKKRIVPEHNFIDYAVFVSYFPLLVAGPIERATHLLPQLKRRREFRYASGVHGVQQILWGLFKKVVVADNCATIVDIIFSSYESQNSITLIGGAVLFAFQIYGDFSGYSDIAIGTSRLFGINLIRNFNNPYFSRDIAEFWRRWHISLTTWFRDYLYIPLGGSRVSRSKVIRNTFIIFLVSGFWHGANWTFIAWGAFHALLFLPLILAGKHRRYLPNVGYGRRYPALKETGSMLFTFLLVVIGWIFFRADSIEEAIDYIRLILMNTSSFPDFSFFIANKAGLSNYTIVFAIISILFLLVIEWHFRESRYGFELKTPRAGLRIACCFLLCLGIYLCHGDTSEFIYFQF